MIPDFYKEKVNLFVALAPFATSNHLENGLLKKAAKGWRLVERAFEKAHFYNVLGLNWWEIDVEMTFCTIFGGTCEKVLRAFADADTSVDNMDRFAVFQADFPAGSSYQDLILFF